MTVELLFLLWICSIVIDASLAERTKNVIPESLWRIFSELRMPRMHSKDFVAQIYKLLASFLRPAFWECGDVPPPPTNTFDGRPPCSPLSDNLPRSASALPGVGIPPPVADRIHTARASTQLASAVEEMLKMYGIPYNCSNFLTRATCQSRLHHATPIASVYIMHILDFGECGNYYFFDSCETHRTVLVGMIVGATIRAPMEDIASPDVGLDLGFLGLQEFLASGQQPMWELQASSPVIPTAKTRSKIQDDRSTIITLVQSISGLG